MKLGSLCSVVMLFLSLFAIQGCAMRMEIGAPPNVDGLSKLTQHVSTKNDVLLTLGEPRSYGMARLSPGLQPQRVWEYEYTVAEGKDIRLTMLLVFFSGDKYDGYMWFADEANLREYREGKSQ
jgi:hypothetical protein